MTTNFALSLSFEGIELLHRVPRGWKPVGRKADVEDPKLDSILADLRDKALALEPGGLRTKIVIPMDQIKYIAIDSTQTDMDDIYRALDGATPYALKDLVIDYEKFGGRTHIAAVARETLFEAEAFARAHKFCPVSYVAVPEPFTFQKEVFFGPTAMMQEVLGPDGKVERDALPVMVVGTRIKSRLLVFDIPDEELPPVDDIDLAALLAPHIEPDPPDVEDQPEPVDDVPVAEVAVTWVDRVVPEVHFAAASPVKETPPVEVVVSAPVAPTLFDLVIAEVAPPVTVEAAPAPTEPPVVAPKTAMLDVAPTAPALLDPIIAEFHAPARSAKTVTPPPLRLTAQPPKVPAALPTLGAAAQNPLPVAAAPRRNLPLYIGGAIAASLALAGVFAWTQIPSPVDEVAMVEAPVLAAVPEIGPDVVAVGPQGLTQPAPAADNPRALTAETAITSTTAPLELATAEPDTLPLPVQAPPEPQQETAQASVGAPVLRGRVLSPDEAAGIYQATGVWQRAARPAPVPRTTSVEGLIRPVTLPVPERIAQPQVPPLDNLDTDLSFLAPADPPPADVTFPVDENGFILATPEGTATPEGAIVIAGLPDLNIRARPELSQAELDRMALLAPAPEGVVIIAGPPSVVPPLRPQGASLPETTPELASDTVPDVEATSAGGVALSGLQPGAQSPETTDTEVASLRPETRPGAAASTVPTNPDITSIIAGITAEEEAAVPLIDPSEGSVAVSQRPELRPQNFARVVAAAREREAARQASVAAAPAPQQTAAPVAPQNYAPVPGGVARAATQEDVIALRSMNLIGVYGRPNARRALVRLSNGRYVRVEVGSALDGGQVTAIGDSALNYVKRGRTYALELPSG